MHGNTISVNIAGGGPSGLTAAITAEHSGLHAVIHERHDGVGHRFHGDFQGLENWTTETDVMTELVSMGVDTSFSHTPFYETVVFGPDGTENLFRSASPLFYLIKRGSAKDSLDHHLKKQVIELGAEIRFNSECRRMHDGGIVAQGPHRADVIAVGCLFDTNSADGAYVVLSGALAPQGYAYLLIHNGRGTLAACIFHDFHNDREYLARTIEFFKRKVGVDMENVHRFGGTGNFSIPRTAVKNNILHVGECGGFQDAFAGFGLRYAMVSGHLAALAVAHSAPRDFDAMWKRRFLGMLRASVVNRYVYAMFGDTGYKRFIKTAANNKDAGVWMRRLYGPAVWKAVIYPLARYKYNRKLKGLCVEPGCHCTWCRCQHDTE